MTAASSPTWAPTGPFDRILVAQAQVEDLLILSRDADIARYDVHVIDATT